MTAHVSVVKILGWRADRAPNIADKGSPQSRAIATAIFETLGVERISKEQGQTLGSLFERAIASTIQEWLADTDRPFEVGREPITAFTQYRHLDKITQLLAEADPEGTLRSEIGTDYLIRPDVTVGLASRDGSVFLHAAVSCKWTIRSDRVQNIRHEGVILGRHRRGRQPHVVTVTCEPLPSRLAAIARGTGEVDAVYHALFDELASSITALDEGDGEVQFGGEHDIFEELVEQDRLRPLEVLPEVLEHY